MYRKRGVPATSIVAAAVNNEVALTLKRWLQGDQPKGVLMGAMAMAFYVKPRYTEDIDLLYMKGNKPETAPDGFKKHRPSAMEDRKTGVEVETVTPDMIGIPNGLAQKVYHTAVVHDGIKVASREGLIALKLYGARSPHRELKDSADIYDLLVGHTTIDMHDWFLEEQDLKLLESIRSRFHR
jgi:hypothetical protein